MARGVDDNYREIVKLVMTGGVVEVDATEAMTDGSLDLDVDEDGPTSEVIASIERALKDEIALPAVGGGLILVRGEVQAFHYKAVPS